MVKACLDGGVNYFDTAETYSDGLAETILGKILKELNVARKDVVVSTKTRVASSFGSQTGPNGLGLSRKHIIEGARGCLDRLQLDYVDMLMAHRPDYNVGLEEVCRAYDWVINKGWALYWGTSEWNADMIRTAITICEKYGLHKPVVEQSQYNCLIRNRLESELVGLLDEKLLGTTVWSPLAQGVLSGKYNDGIDENSRMGLYAKFGLTRFSDAYLGPKTIEKTIKICKGLAEIASENNANVVQLAYAWCLANKRDVSTIIMGASKVEQVTNNLGAVAVYQKWTKELEEKIEALLDNRPENNRLSMQTLQPIPTGRQKSIADL